MEELYNQLLSLICSGKAELYANLEMIKFEPGTVEKINETIHRISERKKILQELKNGKKID